MARIQLFGKYGEGKYSKVDPETFDKYGKYKWVISTNGYVVGYIDKKEFRLHRLIAEASSDKIVDHLNGDKLDNRKANLRCCTYKENNRNHKDVLGYSYDKYAGKYLVRILGKYYGRYDTPEEAARAYRLARSGVVKASAVHPRRKYLPKGVYYMKSHAQKGGNPYYIRPHIEGKKVFKGFFSTPQEALQALAILKDERRIVS